MWSKQLDRENPNVVKIAERAESLAMKLRGRLAEGVAPAVDDAQLYIEVVFYLMYDRFDARLARSLATTEVDFYEDFVDQARFYIAPLPQAIARDVDADLHHWFAFLFQVRRASHHIFDFIVGSSLPAARLRGAVWQSIFTHDLRRYRRSLFVKMSDVATLVTGPSGTGKELVAQAIGLSGYIPFLPKRKRFEIDPAQAFFRSTCQRSRRPSSSRSSSATGAVPSPVPSPIAKAISQCARRSERCSSTRSGISIPRSS